MDGKRRPASLDVSQLQKRYLESLRANAAARKKLEELQQSEDLNIDYQDSTNEKPINASTYVRLLRQRKQHESLQVVHRHVERLSQTPAAQAHFMNFKPLMQDPRALHSTQNIDPQDGTSISYDSIELLTKKLEHAVLQANHRLEEEKRLLAELTAHNQKANSPISKSQKLKGLSAVQNELFAWIEDKLTESQEAEMANASLGEMDDGNGEPEDAPETTDSIDTSYESYLEARKRLLHAVALVSKSTPAPADGGLGSEAFTANDHQDTLTFSLLPTVEKQLLPVYHADEDTKLKLAMLRSNLKESQDQTIQALERLADESHLLAEHPLLGQSGKFRQATRAMHVGTTPEDDDHDSQLPDQVNQKIDAWTFASESATTATETFVVEQLEEGEGRLEQADGYIVQLQKLAGEAPVDADSEGEEEDIWAADINAEAHKARQSRRGGNLRGPWAVLNGRIGLDDQILSR